MPPRSMQYQLQLHQSIITFDVSLSKSCIKGLNFCLISHAGVGWGYSHVKAYRDVPPKWVSFFTQGPFQSKKFLEEGPISPKVQKNCKISHFSGRKTLRNGSQLAKILKKKKINQSIKSATFQGEKSLQMGRGFRLRAAHPIKK